MWTVGGLPWGGRALQIQTVCSRGAAGHIRAERELKAKVQEALEHIQVLHGLLPICAWCKKIRDDSGNWRQMEEYIADHSQAEFSHGICPECKKGLTS